MDTVQGLTGARWRKSSYSADQGDCVECAPLGAAAWRKSSYSGTTGGDCVEVAPQPALVAVRDSKNPDGPAFTVSPAAFAAFVRGL
ncbi:toxin [Streptomyces roseochromogenus]|nr:toxin [Streptomyces roseochromogenus]